MTDTTALAAILHGIYGCRITCRGGRLADDGDPAHAEAYLDTAAFIIEKLPPDWCGHDPIDVADGSEALTTAYMVGYERGKDAADATTARLRRIEEAAQDTVDVFLRLPASLAMRHAAALAALRAALEENQ